jgi:formylglycine-generating enzyme required for sulfatase activity
MVFAATAARARRSISAYLVRLAAGGGISLRRLFGAVAGVFVFILLLTLFCKKGADIPMVRVKGGTFVMGCTAEQGEYCQYFEKPAHEERVGNFLIGRYEVTQKQWVKIMGKNPSYFSGKKGENLPVEGVSWNEVQEFISRLNVATGKRYRLPTEAEWEYAARGGLKSKGYMYSGSDDIDVVAWYDKSGDIKRTKNRDGKSTNPVGTKAPNELGIYDMSGNVTEWVNDKFWYYDGSRSSTGDARVGRGGSWNRDHRYCHVSWRHYYYPDSHFDGLGFRLARDP